MIATLALHLNREKYEVHLALITQSSCSHTRLPEFVQLHCLGTKRARYALFPLLALIQRIRPRLIFFGMAHLAPLALLLTCFGAKAHIILRQDGALSSVLSATGPRAFSWLLLATAYRRIDSIICQTHSTAEELQREFVLDETRLNVLANPVDLNVGHQTDLNPLEMRDPYLVAVGRLVPQKGFDLLLEAFAGLRSEFPRLRLLVAGSGPCKLDLESQCRARGLQNVVELLGEVRDPSRYFAHAAAFVLSSRHDELPNAMLEAAAAGLPIVATPSSHGVTALLTGRSGVWLAKDVSADALRRSLRSALGTLRPDQRFAHDWMQPFALAPAVAAYEEVFDRVLGRHEL